MNLEISRLNGPSIEEQPVEFVERKGKGHPDSICDRTAEELSVALSRTYMEKFGRVLHHNVDKCVLAGGQSRVKFGGGEVVEPIYLLLVGRAAMELKGERIPLDDIVTSAAKGWLRKEMRHLDVDRHIIVEHKIRPGSADLIGNFERGTDIPLANDTSFAVSFAPESPTERIVRGVEAALNSPETKNKYPAIGEDIKVMAVRRGNRLNITVANAIISGEVAGPSEYMETKRVIEEMTLDVSRSITDLETSVRVNAADDPQSGIYYLTVTGSSAEHGDDGQVGRGNRTNGLITPYRPMTLEAACGKNPVTHTGKLYSIVANRIANRLVEKGGVDTVYCYIVSEIGRPITEPKCVNIAMLERRGRVEEAVISSVVRDTLAELPDFWNGFLRREFPLY